MFRKCNCLQSLFLILLLGQIAMAATDGLIPAFKITGSDITLQRRAQTFTPFDKSGRKFSIIGTEGGSFEAWAYPLKLLRGFEFSFLLGESTEKITGAETARWITVTPAATTITYTHQSFTVKAIFITPIDEPGAIILLDVDAVEPLTVVAGFLPVLQPMWPAGLGGQYASWRDDIKAYRISESSRKNVGYVGSPAAVGISYTPAHMLSDNPSEFQIPIDPEAVKGMYIAIVIVGGKGEREHFRAIYQRLAADPEAYYNKTRAHYQALRERTIAITTPNKAVNLAYEWAKVAYDNLMITNPNLGTGLVAGLGLSGTGGRPGFGWYFGGDTYMNSFSMVGYGAHEEVKTALKFMMQFQREDGKMAHEISQSANEYIDWFGDYPYAYIHGDTSPWYLAAMGNYLKVTGDVNFIRESWESIMKAYRWSLATDGNHDGLMDNKLAGLGALEYGPLTGILTDVYLAAIWVKGLEEMIRMAAILGETDVLAEVETRHTQALKTLNNKFWDRKNKHLSYAFNEKGKTIPEVNPWSGPGMMWNLFDGPQSHGTLARINTSELTTDWGIRTISNRSKYYEPLNYNYGAIWPFLAAFISTARYQHHFAEAGFHGLMTSVNHTFDNGLGTITEVFSGDLNVWPGESVHHQGFSSAGAVLPLITGLLGLDVDAPNHAVTFAPHLPADWNALDVVHVLVGGSVVDFHLTRTREKMLLKVDITGDPVRIIFAPAYRTGAVTGATFNDERLDHTITESRQDAHVTVVADVFSQATITINFSPSFDVVFPVAQTHTGDQNRGMKVIECQRKANSLKFVVEGLAGESYPVKVVNAEYVGSITGGTLSGDEIMVTIKPRKQGGFVRHTLEIKGK